MIIIIVILGSIYIIYTPNIPSIPNIPIKPKVVQQKISTEQVIKKSEIPSKIVLVKKDLPITIVPVGYNVFDVPDDNVKTMYQIETEQLNNIFDKFNKKELPDYQTSFQKYPTFTKFPLIKYFQKKIIDTINLLFSTNELKNSKISIVKDIYQMYFKEIDNVREFIFLIDLNNQTKNSTRQLEIYITLNNINNYLMDSGEYSPTINDDIIKDIDINYIGTKTNSISLEVPGLTENIHHEYYRIKNTLRLMDPYITSGKEMVITDGMRKNFDIILDKKKTKILKREGFCYNLTDTIAKTKEECTAYSGVWDYPPDDDIECPYYEANKNYPNNFGGLKNDSCELPKNMKLIGYRYFSQDPTYAPMCYNCKEKSIDNNNTLGFCCDTQKTPDYAYEGDIDLRKKYTDVLTQNNLSVN
jgi:hypothetical protein